MTCCLSRILYSVVFTFLFLRLNRFCVCKDLFIVKSNTFELTIASHPYLAVLFYDEYDLSERNQQLKQNWTDSVLLFDQQSSVFPAEAELGIITGRDQSFEEILRLYSIKLPSIKIFRYGNPVEKDLDDEVRLISQDKGSSEFPSISPEDFLSYLLEDVKVKISFIHSL
jgi:hypothetical protein